MKLTVFDRIMILSCLPIEGDLSMIKILRKLREDLSFADTERLSIGMKFDAKEKDYSWRRSTTLVKEIKTNASIMELIKSSLRRALLKLNGLKKINAEHLGIAEKFFNENEINEMMGVDRAHTGKNATTIAHESNV